MIQTHLMKLEPPYPVLNIDGTIVRHVATLIEVREVYDSKTGEERIKTLSHPVVDYGNNHYAGVVYEDKTIEDCEVLPPEISPVTFYMLLTDIKEKVSPNSIAWRPDIVVSRLEKLGVTIQWPTKKDSEGFDTDIPEDKFSIGLSMNKLKDGTWVCESGDNFFCFDGGRFKSDKELLAYIRNLRSSYYKAFPDRQFDIVFHNNMPETKYLLDELNANPHL